MKSHLFILTTLGMVAPGVFQVSTNPGEFVVSDPSQIFYTGVAPVPSYSERDYSSEEIVSVPGCPKSINGYPWVLYAINDSNPNCYLVGESPTVCQGLTIHYQSGSSYGLCQCDFQKCLDRSRESFHGNHSSSSSSGSYRFCAPNGRWGCSELVYFQAEQRCYDVYSKGPCKNAEWLEPDGHGGVRCSPRKCPEGSGLDEDTERELETTGTLAGKKSRIGCCEPVQYGQSNVPYISSVQCDSGRVWSELRRTCIRQFSKSNLIVG